jgi:hypothetical protein
MVARKLLDWAVVPASLLAIACSGHASDSDGAAHFPEQALSSTLSNSGTLSIELRTSPEQPPTHGVISAELTLHDAQSGAPAAGLTLAVTPWMPAMGHGTSTLPAVSETAAGVYLVEPISAYMPGTWQLRTDVAGSVADHVDLSLELQ